MIGSLKLMMLFLVFICIRSADADELKLILLDPDNLAYGKVKIGEKDEIYLRAYKKLCTDADQFLQTGPFSVVFKKILPPSGDRHDFMSIGPYWWPDTSKPDGLPYIRFDGEVNPERNLYDNVALDSLDVAVTSLSLAYYFSGKESYAQHTARLIRTWFLNDETRMNPHLKFGQAIRGRVDGRGIGIIDTRAFIRVAESIGLIGASGHWSEQDQIGMEKWFSDYIDWLQNSEFGIDERDHQNNHGTWYDVLVTSLAIFTGRNELAHRIFSQVPLKRIAVQIDAEGKQPFELDRTRAYHYSMMNLQGLFQLALMAEKIGIDLWSYRSDNDGSLRKGLDYLIPFALNEKKWTYQMIRGWEDDIQTLSFLLRVAANKYNHPAYEKMIHRLPGRNHESLVLTLLFPNVSR